MQRDAAGSAPRTPSELPTSRRKALCYSKITNKRSGRSRSAAPPLDKLPARIPSHEKLCTKRSAVLKERVAMALIFFDSTRGCKASAPLQGFCSVAKLPLRCKASASLQSFCFVAKLLLRQSNLVAFAVGFDNRGRPTSKSFSDETASPRTVHRYAARPSVPSEPGPTNAAPATIMGPIVDVGLRPNLRFRLCAAWQRRPRGQPGRIPEHSGKARLSLQRPLLRHHMLQHLGQNQGQRRESAENDVQQRVEAPVGLVWAAFPINMILHAEVRADGAHKAAPEQPEEHQKYYPHASQRRQGGENHQNRQNDVGSDADKQEERKAAALLQLGEVVLHGNRQLKLRPDGNSAQGHHGQEKRQQRIRRKAAEAPAEAPSADPDLVER
eukprot:scaffold600_cov279-Pinguiococcus_pyrenoidosus.AAC.7